VDELFIETQPAHLQKGAQVVKMSSEERDALRATIIRAKLSQVPQPDIARLRLATPATTENQ
jgi:protein arginine kinase